LKRNSSPFSPQKNGSDDNQALMAHAFIEERVKGRELVGDSFWLSRKMADDGCTLGQMLQVMEERCKGCDIISPMMCVEQCETWKTKREILEINRVISGVNHEHILLGSIKNRRRLAILDILWKRSFSLNDLQRKLTRHGFNHSQKTIGEYLKPLLKAGLVKENSKRFELTLYGRKVHDAVVKHGFEGRLPIHSGDYEEGVLRSLLDGAKTRSELLDVVPLKTMSRTLKRLLERKLILKKASPDRVFYFRTRRPLSLESLSPTQKRICNSILQAGISARDLSRIVGINLRQVYKYLRGLRGKKLVFRRYVPVRYELTAGGKGIAEFLAEVVRIR